MIPARKNKLGDWIVGLLAGQGLRGMFGRVYLHVDGPAPQRDDPTPLILYVTHTAWWDGYMAWLICRNLWNLQTYLMMDERQLRRYIFFSWAGCFSISRDSSTTIEQSLNYAAQVLQAGPGRVLWIFPQGKIVPTDRRPLHLASGTARIAARLPRATVRPVALRYEFRGEQHPEAFIWVGEPKLTGSTAGVMDNEALTAQMAACLTEISDAMRNRLLNNDLTPFHCILQGRMSVNRRFDAWLGRRQIPRHDAES